ncbi:MAG: S-layer homology domain-containing protein [Clostridia bacterium]|nr:S-layer homology domain-containing protein [Clostridia bacterium]
MKKLISLLSAFILLFVSVVPLLPASALAPSFSDVAKDRWSYDSVIYAVENGYMNGVGGDRFDPSGHLTRGMVATVLWRREGSPVPSAPSGFTDVAAGAWYTDAVAWAKETGVVNGMTATTFSPNGYITREQLATMLFRFSSTAPVSVPERADLTSFSDDEKASVWAEESLGWAVESGLINGTDGKRLAPGEGATREQFAAIIKRYDDSFKLSYNAPVVRSYYTEKEYPLVKDADFYVAVDGDDKADGSFDRPFATWERARDAVRSLDRTGRTGITVAFMAGEYASPSVELSAEDSGTAECPVTYCKYGDGDVIFSGGVTLGADSFEPLSEEEKGLFPERAVPKIGKADISDILTCGTDDIVIFTEDGILSEARFPNKYEDGTDQLITNGAAAASRDSYRLTSRLLINRIKSYHTVDGMKVYGYIVRGYQKHTIKVASYDPDTNIILLANPEAGDYYGGINPEKDDCEMAFLNISEELDSKGEYWIDPETATLYVFEPEGDLRFPMSGTMVTMRSADYITFRGLTMINARERFIDESMGRCITVDGCVFSCAVDASSIGGETTVGVKGLSFEDHPDGVSKDLVFTGNTFELFYGAAVKVNGNCEGEHRFDRTTNVLFDNNLVRLTNLGFDFRCGIDMPSSSSLKFSHNRFEKCARGAVSYSRSYDVLVEYNDFDSVMQNATDGGILYADWGADARNVVVRYNCFNYVAPTQVGTYGYYIDDVTSGAEVYSNIFWNTGNCALMVHDGRDNCIHDNIVIGTSGSYDGEFGFSVVSSRPSVEESVTAGTLERDKTDEWGIRRTLIVWGEEVLDKCAQYVNYKNAISERWPQILGYHLDFENRDDPNFVFNNVNEFSGNVYFNESGNPGGISEDELILKYRTVTNETGYTLGENPIFVNPTKGDYRVRDGVGFPDIHFEDVGRY